MAAAVVALAISAATLSCLAGGGWNTDRCGR